MAKKETRPDSNHGLVDQRRTSTIAPAADGLMSKTERAELSSIIKRNYKVARASVDLREAELMADFEAQMAKLWEPMEVTRNETMERAKAAVADLNREIEQTFAERGLIKEFAPHASVGWSWRGENMMKERRAELRRVAQIRVEAVAMTAKHELDKAEAWQLTALASSAITSDEARAFLGRIPSIKELMPALEVDPLEVKRLGLKASPSDGDDS